MRTETKHTIDWAQESTSLSYSSLPKLLGAKTLAWCDDHDYQGDSHALLEHGGEFGFLTFGWGSCSGCDAMEAAYGDRAAERAVLDGLCESIIWFATLREAKDHVSSRDTANHFGCHGDGWEEFTKEVSEL